MIVRRVKWYRQAAEQGLAAAQFSLGLKCANGEGVPTNLKEAVKWYRRAAEQGDAEAQLDLAFMYARGKGVLKDRVKAYGWWILAADQGEEIAVEGQDILKAVMTTAQLTAAQKLAAELREHIEASKSK